MLLSLYVELSFTSKQRNIFPLQNVYAIQNVGMLYLKKGGRVKDNLNTCIFLLLLMSSNFAPILHVTI